MTVEYLKPDGTVEGISDDFSLEMEPGPAPVATAVIRIDPDSDGSALALYNEALALRRYAEARVVQSVEDIALATDDLSFVAKLRKALEQKRKEYVDPINAHLKAVNDAFKRLASPLEEADVLTRQKIMDYKREEARKAAEVAEINRLRIEAARREARLNEGELSEETKLIPEVQAPPARIRAETATLGTMRVRKYRVVDFALLPDQYKLENAALLTKVVKAGIPGIPGVEIYEDEVLRMSGR